MYFEGQQDSYGKPLTGTPKNFKVFDAFIETAIAHVSLIFFRSEQSSANIAQSAVLAKPL